VQNKVPGLRSDEVEQMRMDLLYSKLAKRQSRKLPQAYERLLLEVRPAVIIIIIIIIAGWIVFEFSLYKILF